MFVILNTKFRVDMTWVILQSLLYLLIQYLQSFRKNGCKITFISSFHILNKKGKSIGIFPQFSLIMRVHVFHLANDNSLVYLLDICETNDPRTTICSATEVMQLLLQNKDTNRFFSTDIRHVSYKEIVYLNKVLSVLIWFSLLRMYKPIRI